jgi:hypothetical protein
MLGEVWSIAVLTAVPTGHPIMDYTPALFQNVARHDRLGFWGGQKLDYRRVAEFLDLTTQDVARLSGVAKSSVRFDDKIPLEVKERLEWTANICNLVFDFFGNDATTALWFKAPNPMLGIVAPRDMIRLGGYKKLLLFVTQGVGDNRTREQEAPTEHAAATPTA